MALVKLSGTISDIRGKVGGLIFSNSGAGLVAKSFTSPVNPNTIRQNNQRIVLSIVQQEWILLTQAQRDCWHTWIQLFPIKQNNFNGLPINAQQAFIKVNVPFVLYGHPIIKNPVFAPGLRQTVDFTLIIFGVSVRLTTSRTMNNTVEFIELFCTYPKSPTVNNPGTTYKSIIFATKNSVNHFVQNEYVAIFGRTPVSGEKVFFKARLIDLRTGSSTNFQTKLAEVS